LTQVTDIWSLVEPYLAAEKLELDDLELTGQGRGRVLRVTVDGEDVNIERLAEVSRGLSRLLDNETDLDGEYQLEVSSPGLERRLKRPSHYVKSVGREVAAKVSRHGTTETVRGIITSADEQGFKIEGEQGESDVAYDEVISARTVFRLEKTPKPGHSRSNR
jgi:ribosome maturation factor RimP